MFPAEIDERTQLLLLELRHADEIFRVVDTYREELREWLPWVDSSQSVENTREFIRTWTAKRDAGDGFAAGFWHAGQFAGGFGLHAIDTTNLSTGIGYWLAPSYRGRGYITRACQLVLDHVFHELKLNRVEIQCAVDNVKSRAIPERLGFVQEGILRQAAKLTNRYADMVVYSMLAEEWKDAEEATFV